MNMRIFLSMLLMTLMISVGVSAYDNAASRSANADATESLYGEWWLVGWNDGGTWVEVDTNYVCHQHLSIEIPEEGYVMAYSMVNEIYVGILTLNGNEMLFEGEKRGVSTKVYCDVVENLFFEDYICDIKSYQLDGNQLKLYYTDNDYFLFTKEFDDSEASHYEWKDGPADPYIGEVTAMSNGEVEVEIINSPLYAVFYSRTMPPLGNREKCHFSASDLWYLSLKVGDKLPFRIIQFKRLNVGNRIEYQLKVGPCEGVEYVTGRTGIMHNDQRMGWIIIDNEVNEQEGAIYYYPLENLDDRFLKEGQFVTFSAELYLTVKKPWDNKGQSDCYYASIRSIALSSLNDVRIGGLRYYLFPETHEAAINTGNTWIGELDIPSEIEYNGELFTVTGIAQVAFGDCEELTKVRIPKTINHIVHGILTDDPNISGGGRDDYNECMNPFWRCTALESIEVDADNPIMSSDDGILFSKDKTQLYSYPSGKQQETYIIPENITWIGNGVFSSNVYLSSLTMPNSVAFIGGDLCSNCVNLKSVRLSESITFIPAYAFDKCESLTLLDIPESVQEFGESVFRWTHLKKLVIRGTFPNGLRDDTFMFMDEATVLYVQQSEIEKFKKVFSGTVLPLEEYTSNIEQVKQHQQSAPLYDLQGRRLTSQPSKGVYIQSGKKIVVK